MSLLSRDRVRIALCPDRAVLLRLARGRRIAERAIVPCDAGLESLLAALRAALSEPRWADAAVTVILSNHFVRYRLVSFDDKLETEDERQAMVRHSFRQAHGDGADRWDVRWSPPRAASAPSLACAVERALVDGVRAACAAAGLRLVSLQPYLMAACNRWRSVLREPAQWFALVEPGRLCLARLARGEWLRIHSERVSDAWRDELRQILAREVLLSSLAEAGAKLYLHAPEAPDAGLAFEGQAVRLLKLAPMPGFSPSADACYAMAVGQ